MATPEEIAAMRPWERYQYYMGQYAQPGPTSAAVAGPQMAAPAPGGNPLQLATSIAVKKGVSSLMGGGSAAGAGGVAGAGTGAGTAGGVAGAGAGATNAGTGGAAQVAPGMMTKPLESLGGASAAQALGAIAAAKGAYDTYGSLQSGGKGIRSSTTTLGSGIGTMILPGVGTAIGAAGGNILGYGLQGKGTKNDIALAATSPELFLLRKFGIWDPVHKTTRQYAQENTNRLLDVGQDNKPWQEYVAGMREQYNSAPPDPSKPFAGKYGSWDEYKTAGLDAADLTGVYGNLDAYGPKYAGLTFDQKKALTQKNIDAGNYYSSKGDVKIADKAKAAQIWDDFQKVVAAPARKDSPGFKDGKRINYGGR